MFQEKLFIISIFFICIGYSYAQEEEDSVEYKHGLSFLVTHSYISQGRIEGEREYISAPSFGLNYNYMINEQWAIGLHNDIIIESFVVENPSDDTENLERELPISNLITGYYKLKNSLAFLVGVGIEWEKNENFALVRLGIDYTLELNEKGLEMIFVFNYDNLINAYDGINFGIGLNKLF